MAASDDDKSEIPLGKTSEYTFSYDASLLFPIARSEGREASKISTPLPFYGVDHWTAYEFSWLNNNGLPQVAIVEFTFQCTAPTNKSK